MKSFLEFKDRIKEESFKNYKHEKRSLILHMQIGAVGLFSFLGLFHLIYLHPVSQEISISTSIYLVVAGFGILFSVLMTYYQKLQQNDWIILFTNLLINFMLIEPNFLVITKTLELSKLKYFWLGFRISSIHLVMLMCFNSFFYKILQTSITIIYLMIRMKDDMSLHNLLVDSSIGILICIFFYNTEKGERKIYSELYGIALQREKWKDFLNFLPDGVAIFTGDYNCHFMNNSVKNIFNLSSLDDIKRTILNLKWMNSNFCEVRDSRFSTRFPTAIKLKDHFHSKETGNTETSVLGFWNEAFFSEYNGKYLSIKFTEIDFDDMESVLVLISDISVTIKSQALALEECKKFRDMLFASFSHEIRTPLNCILLLLGKFIKGTHSVSEKLLKKYIYPSFYSGQILLHLVNNILDYSFLLRDELSLKISSIDIKAECLEIMEVISLQAQSKGITLILKLERNLPKIIRTDATRMKQILCHLLLNALKFTYEGKIILRVTNSDYFETGISITVKDTGIGMNLEEQKRLNEKLRKTAFSTFKVAENGAGASLKTLLSQNLALMIGFQEGGGIKFSSEVNKGSEFQFILKNFINEINEGISYDQVSELEKSKNEEKVSSGILIKWVSYKSHPNNKRKELLPKSKDITQMIKSKEVHNQECRDSTISQRLKYEYYCNMCSLDKNRNKVRIENEDPESLVSERNDSKKTIPDFEDLMLIKQRRKQKETKFKSENMYKPIKDSNDTSILNELKINCSHSKILVVDDDEFNILAVKAILKQKKFSVCSARNGAQAIELIHKETKERNKCCTRFHLIFMDVNMPVMGGLEATRILKKDMKDRRLPWTPIIGCTAFVGTSDEVICRESGMDDYETKPLNDSKLTRLLQRWSLEPFLTNEVHESNKL